jgi:hypothetical protein
MAGGSPLEVRRFLTTQLSAIRRSALSGGRSMMSPTSNRDTSTASITSANFRARIRSIEQGESKSGAELLTTETRHGSPCPQRTASAARIGGCERAPPAGPSPVELNALGSESNRFLPCVSDASSGPCRFQDCRRVHDAPRASQGGRPAHSVVEGTCLSLPSPTSMRHSALQ